MEMKCEMNTKIIVNEVNTKNYLVKSKLPASDFVINPYIGCTHGCKYCYARFMKRFTKHNEDWGKFLDIKLCNSKIDINKIKNKTVFISSVTDCYNHYEKKYKVTRKILEQLLLSEAHIIIVTKSKLVLRDLDILTKFKDVNIAISLNTLDENFRCDMDKASTIAERLSTLQILKENGIYCTAFISPIFPEITNVLNIVTEMKDYVDEFWFEDLNLRGEFKHNILTYIRLNYPQLLPLYNEIYLKKNSVYWEQQEKLIREFCDMNNIKYKIFFDHNKLVSEKLKNDKKR